MWTQVRGEHGIGKAELHKSSPKICEEFSSSDYDLNLVNFVCSILFQCPYFSLCP